MHRDFCEVAIGEKGRIRSAGRVATRVDALEVMAQSLLPGDVVAVEATSGSDRILCDRRQVTDAFGTAGRNWLAELELPVDGA